MKYGQFTQSLAVLALMILPNLSQAAGEVAVKYFPDVAVAEVTYGFGAGGNNPFKNCVSEAEKDALAEVVNECLPKYLEEYAEKECKKNKVLRSQLVNAQINYDANAATCTTYVFIQRNQ